MKNIAIFTIISCNYAAFATTLLQSVKEIYGEEASLFVYAADTDLPPINLSFLELRLASSLPIPHFDRFSFRYDILEFNTAIKPFCFEQLLGEGFEQVLYFDPDIIVFRRLNEAHDALQRGASIVLTPHITNPLEDGRHPSDHDIMKSGIYNFGFFAVRNCAESLHLLRWWQRRCEYECRVDIKNNVFTDQRWMDLAPTFAKKHKIMFHPGYNVAYWNLIDRIITLVNSHWLVSGEDLVFFHFSGFDPEYPTKLSKHQNRPLFATNPLLNTLLSEYSKKLINNGWMETKLLEYGYARFASGRPITKHMRRAWLSNENSLSQPIGVPAVDLECWFDLVDHEQTKLGPPYLTRHVVALLDGRSDLQREYHVQSTHGRAGLSRWLVEGGGLEAGLDEVSIQQNNCTQYIEAAQKKRFRDKSIRVLEKLISSAGPITLPEWLGETIISFQVKGLVDIPLTREMALSLCERSDLQTAFMPEGDLKVIDFWLWLLGTDGKNALSRFAFQSTEAISWLAALVRRPVYENDFLATRLATLLTGVLKSDSESLNINTSHGVEYLFRIYLHVKKTPALTPFTERVRRALLYRDMLRFTSNIADCHLSNASALIRYLCRESKPAYNLIDLANGHNLHDSVNCIEQDQEVAELDEDLREGLRLEIEDRSALQSNNGNHYRRNFARSGTKTPLMQGKPKLVVTGFFQSPSGRGEDARLIRDALIEVGMSPVTLDRSTGQLLDTNGAPAQRDDIREEINICVLNADTAHADFLWLDNQGMGRGYRIGVWAWELSRFPDKWKHQDVYYDEIWCSSEFAFSSIKAGRENKCFYVPMPVVTEQTLDVDARDLFNLPREKYIFYYSFDFRSYPERKNPKALIQAFKEAFPDNSHGVALFIKSSNAHHDIVYWKELKRLCADDLRVEIRDRLYDRKELITILSAVDCFVSPHRAEGFGRGPAEALLHEKAVIVTDYSGTRDFCTVDTAKVIPYSLVSVNEGAYVDVTNQVWAEVDIMALARAMRDAVEHRDIMQTLSRRGRTIVQEKYSISVSGRAMRSRIEASMSVYK